MLSQFMQFSRNRDYRAEPPQRRRKHLVGSGCLLTLTLILCGSTRAYADTPMALDRVSLWLGGFYPTVDARLSADGPDSSGSDVDFRRDLGLDRHRVLSNARLDFLVFDNQGFSVGGYHYSRFASTALTRDIRFAGIDYQADASVSARFSLQTFDASWHWWFTPSPRDVLGFGLGVAYYDLNVVIDGNLTVNGDSASGRGQVDGSAFAPLLTIGWKHAFSDRFRLFANVSGLKKNGGQLTGHLLNARLGLEYFPWQDLGLALEYDSSDLTLHAEKESWQGQGRIRFQGPAAFVRLRL